ncbi:MAG: hypothetical protein ACLU4P_08900 [Ruminococcus sp.]
MELLQENERKYYGTLWGGRFTKETDKLVYNFNASISFDQKFYEQDIRGSKAHVKMLAKQGILTEEERDQHHGRSGRNPRRCESGAACNYG